MERDNMLEERERIKRYWKIDRGGRECKIDSPEKMRAIPKSCSEDCLENEVTSWGDGLFKLSINLSHKKDLNYIDEFESKADGGKLRPHQDWDQSNQVQFHIKINSLISQSIYICRKWCLKYTVCLQSGLVKWIASKFTVFLIEKLERLIPL